MPKDIIYMKEKRLSLKSQPKQCVKPKKFQFDAKRHDIFIAQETKPEGPTILRENRKLVYNSTEFKFLCRKTLKSWRKPKSQRFQENNNNNKQTRKNKQRQNKTKNNKKQNKKNNNNKTTTTKKTTKKQQQQQQKKKTTKQKQNKNKTTGTQGEVEDVQSQEVENLPAAVKVEQRCVRF